MTRIGFFGKANFPALPLGYSPRSTHGEARGGAGVPPATKGVPHPEPHIWQGGRNVTDTSSDFWHCLELKKPPWAVKPKPLALGKEEGTSRRAKKGSFHEREPAPLVTLPYKIRQHLLDLFSLCSQDTGTAWLYKSLNVFVFILKS